MKITFCDRSANYPLISFDKKIYCLTPAVVKFADYPRITVLDYTDIMTPTMELIHFGKVTQEKLPELLIVIQL